MAPGDFEMSTPFWFEDLSVVGGLPPAQAFAKLAEISGDDSSDGLEAGSEVPWSLGALGLKGLWPFTDKPWQHTAHAFGHLAPAPPGAALLPIRHAGNIEPDLGLRSSRIKIALSG
jgi:hypothetical protein